MGGPSAAEGTLARPANLTCPIGISGQCLHKPVRTTDLLDASIAKLETFQQNMDKANGARADERFTMRVGGDGTLAGAIAFATARAGMNRIG